MNQVNRNFQGSLCGALAVTGLQQEELFILDGEFHILHISIVIFQKVCRLHEFFIDLRHFFFQMSDGGRRTDTGHDVFTLRVDEVFAEDCIFAGSRVTRKGNTRTGGIGHITEDHLLHVNGGAQIVGNFIHLAVQNGAFIVPAFENGCNGFFKLFTRILREFFVGQFLIQNLVLFGDFL